MDQEKLFEEYKNQVDAIQQSQAVIEFNPDGTIITANDNFLSVLEYSLSEVQGKHHRMFCDDDYVKTDEYKEFWAKLNRGEFNAGTYARVTKSKKTIYISATYNPLKDKNGKVYKVIKFASDMTEAVVAAQMKYAVDGSATPYLVCDRDLVITYKNTSFDKLYTDNREEFHKAFPNFNLDSLLGTNIDIFHKDPSIQRKILGNPANLPYQAEIRLAGMYVILSVSAMYDSDGNYVGNALEWNNVTERKLSEDGLNRTIAEVASSTSNLNNSTGNLKNLASDLADRSKNIAEEVNTVATGTEEMSVNMGTVANVVEKAVSNINSVAESTQQMTETSVYQHLIRCG